MSGHAVGKRHHQSSTYLFFADVAFLISDQYKKERTGSKITYGDLLYSELGGRKLGV